MKYVYWTVVCTTPGCSNRHFAKFIGEDKEPAYRLLQSCLPEVFFHECDKCGKVHTYTPADMVPYSVDLPPIEGFREWW